MTATKAFTVEDVERFAADGRDFELLQGELIEVSPTSRRHGRSAGNILVPLSTYVKKEKAGEAFVEVGFILQRNPDVLLGPDVSFVRADCLTEQDEDGFLPLAPDLAVEVISPSERRGTIARKVRAYLDAGVPLLWLVYPLRGNVVVHEAGQPPRTLSEDDTLDGGAVLPGFTLPVREIFT